MREGRYAACPLLIAASRDEGGRRMLCDKASECHTCSLFQAHVSQRTFRPEVNLYWACFRCLDVSEEKREEQGKLLGYYRSGGCSYCGQDSAVLNAVLSGA